MSKVTTSPPSTRAAPTGSRSIARAAKSAAAESGSPAAKLGTPAMPRHRLRQISFAPIQRCGCTKHYEKPLRAADD